MILCKPTSRMLLFLEVIPNVDMGPAYVERARHSGLSFLAFVLDAMVARKRLVMLVGPVGDLPRDAFRKSVAARYLVLLRLVRLVYAAQMNAAANSATRFLKHFPAPYRKRPLSSDRYE